MSRRFKTRCVTLLLSLPVLGLGAAAPVKAAVKGKEDPSYHLAKGKQHPVPIQVTVAMANLTFEHTTRQATVAGLLKELGVPLSPRLLVRPAPETPLLRGGKVVLSRLVREKMTFATPLAAPTRTVARVIGPGQPTPVRKQEVVNPGKEGEGELISIYYFQDGDLLGYTEVTRVLKPAAERVVVKYEKAPLTPQGHGQFFAANFKKNRRDPGYAIPQGAPPPSFRSRLTMTATAYTSDDPGVGTRTAMGWRLRQGVVAVDPRRVPMGTRLYIKGYGYGVAADTGGAIKGNKIDLAFNTRRSAFQFGRRKVEVLVLD